MGDAEIFAYLTVILFTLGVIMPFVHSFATGENVDNNIEGVEEGIDGTTASIGWTTVLQNLLKSFFWYYGELPLLLNAIKIMLNVIWLYILVKLIPFVG